VCSEPLTLQDVFLDASCPFALRCQISAQTLLSKSLIIRLGTVVGVKTALHFAERAVFTSGTTMKLAQLTTFESILDAFSRDEATAAKVCSGAMPPNRIKIRGYHCSAGFSIRLF